MMAGLKPQTWTAEVFKNLLIFSLSFLKTFLFNISIKILWSALKNVGLPGGREAHSLL
jgi:hypothetical protein